MIIKRKPCPFCGEKDRKKLKTQKLLGTECFAPQKVFSTANLQTECQTCWAKGPLVEFYDEIVPVWNSRAEVET